MKKTAILVVAILINSMLTSCTNRDADESEYIAIHSGVDGEDEQTPDEDIKPIRVNEEDEQKTTDVDGEDEQTPDEDASPPDVNEDEEEEEEETNP